MWHENTVFSSIMFILENFYYLSGIALFLIGIKQITLSKKQSKTKHEREAVTLSIKQSEIFAREISNLAVQIDKVLIDAKIDLSKVIESLPKESKSPFSIPKTICYKTLNEIQKKKKLDEYLELANRLEAFSTYFVTGVAHSETAYKTLGRLYCHYIVLISPVLTSLKSNQNSFLHINELYNLWKNKLEAEKATEAFILASSKDKQHFDTLGTQ